MLVPHIITISTHPARLSWLPGQTKSSWGDIQCTDKGKELYTPRMTVEYTGGWWGGILFSTSLPQVQIHVSLWALTLAQDSRETEALGKHRVDSAGLWVWRRVSKQAVGKSCNPLRITPLEQTWHEAVPLSPKTHKLEPQSMHCIAYASVYSGAKPRGGKGNIHQQ
jgi:hypothetical protein